MIARKTKCKLCGTEYLARWDDVINDFATHCSLNISTMQHYIKHVELNDREDAESFRVSMERFVDDVQKFLIELSEVDDRRTENIFYAYDVRL